MRNRFHLPCHVVCFFFCLNYSLAGQHLEIKDVKPDTVTFLSGDLQLKGLLWKPSQTGTFPAVLYNHGSEARPERYVSTIVPAFLEHGYSFFMPFRRGHGFSKGQGRYIVEELDSVAKVSGADSRFKLMIRLHETTQLQDQLGALTFLKSYPGIDPNRIAVMGISFGGIQTMLMAGRDVGIKAGLNFAGAAMTWEKSPEVAAWLKEKAAIVKVPVYFIQAANDFSTKPSTELSAEMKRLGKPYHLKIYPASGKTPMEGHTFIDSVNVWGPDVFPLLGEWMNGDNPEREIRGRNDLWNTAFNQRDTVAFFSLFNAESILTTGGGRWVGIERCKSLIKGLFRNRPDITWVNSAEKIEVFKFWNIAYETGTWIETWTEKNDSAKSEIIGKYWIMYRYEDDQWVIHSSIFTPLSCAGSYCRQF